MNPYTNEVFRDLTDVLEDQKDQTEKLLERLHGDAEELLDSHDSAIDTEGTRAGRRLIKEAARMGRRSKRRAQRKARRKNR